MPRNKGAKPIFVYEDTGDPVSIHLETLISRQIREEWTAKIERHGGIVVRDDVEADYVVCSKKGPNYKSVVQSGYAASIDPAKRRIIVQYIDFLEECIGAGKLVAIKENVKRMSGQVQQERKRVPFTADDVDNMCRYIAAILPERGSGGRRGDNFWKQLEQLGTVKPDFAWAKRHTWQAWRNKYNKRPESFENQIQGWVARINPKKIHRFETDRRVNYGRYKGDSSEESSEEETRNKEQDPDKTEDTEDDDVRPGPPSRKGKGRAPPKDDNDDGDGDEYRPDQNENENDGKGTNRTPPPRNRQSGGANDSWEVIDDDHIQPPMDIDEAQADSAPSPRSPGRHARFASNAVSKRVSLERSSKHSRGAPIPNKRPRLSAESATSTGSQPLRRGARLPPGKVPGVKAESDPEDDEDEDKSDSEGMDVAHSLFSEGEVEPDQDEDQEDQLEPEAEEEVISGLSEARPPTIPSAASSTVFPISTDRTLVMTASPRKATAMSPRRIARLSSASRKDEYITLDQIQEPEAKVLEVIVVEDDEEEELGEGEIEQDQQMEDEPEEPIPRRRSPSVEVVSHQSSPKVVEAPPPTAQKSRDRRRRAEQQAQLAPPPVRMTRARSQSVEPTEFVSLPSRPSKRKRVGKAKVAEPEPEIMEEVIEEVDEEQEGVPEERITGKETLADEEDVMNIITNEDDFSNISNTTSASQQSSKTISQQHSPPEPSSDDEQVMRRIATQREQLKDTVVKKGPRKSAALVDAFKAGLAATMKTPVVRRALPPNVLEDPARSISAHQKASEQKRTPRPFKAPYTPTRAPSAKVQPPSRMRAVSTASSSNETAESIPMPGTRAKAFKVKVEEEEKYTPYAPPRGTRASLYTQGRQAARSSKRG